AAGGRRGDRAAAVGGAPGAPVRALLLGFGDVGRAAAEVLAGPARYPRLAGLDVSVIGVVTGSHGALVNPRGLDLSRALDEWRGHGRFTPGHPDHAHTTALEAVRGLDYDVMVELTP